MRFLWLLPAWLFINLSLIGPQVVMAWTHSIALGVVVGLVTIGALTGLCLRVASSRNGALVGVGIVVVIVGLAHGIGTKDIQLAASVQQGKALDGVTMAEALARGEKGTWVRLTDARVRAEDAHTFHFTSGEDRRGATATRTQVSVAPVTLASEVTNEMGPLRVRTRGPKRLWACAESMGNISAWDNERQAVRGRLEPMEAHVVLALEKELNPSRALIPGAGAIPAAPGAMPSMPAPAAISVAPQPLCVELDRALDAKSAGEGIMTTALAFLMMIPLLGLGMLAVALSKGDDSSS